MGIILRTYILQNDRKEVIRTVNRCQWTAGRASSCIKMQFKYFIVNGMFGTLKRTHLREKLQQKPEKNESSRRRWFEKVEAMHDNIWGGRGPRPLMR